MHVHPALAHIDPEPTGYPDTLGDEHAADLGRVGYCQMPKRLDDGGFEWCLVVAPLGSSKILTQSLKVKLLKAAAALVGGTIAERVNAADSDLLKQWARNYAQRSESCRISQYVGVAPSHAALGSQVSYCLDESSGSVPVHLLDVVE